MYEEDAQEDLEEDIVGVRPFEEVRTYSYNSHTQPGTLRLFDSDESQSESDSAASWRQRHLAEHNRDKQVALAYQDRSHGHYSDMERLTGLSTTLTQQTHSLSHQTHQHHDEDVKAVYAELEAISNKLKREYRILQEREIILKERERVLNMSHNNVKRIAEDEVNQRWTVLEEQHQNEMQKMEQIVREKVRENKRLKDGFDTLKNANESVRKELERLQIDHEKLEKHHSSLQARLTNLQRKQEFSSNRPASDILPVQHHSDKVKPEFKEPRPVQKTSRQNSSVCDVLAVLLDWVSEVHLRHNISALVAKHSTSPHTTSLPSMEHTQEKCLRVLPPLVDILRDLPSTNVKICLPCLQFIYWSLLHIDLVQGQQKTSLSSTLRRLGEELYRPKMVRLPTEADNKSNTVLSSPGRSDKTKDNIFFKSASLHTRFLSCLIILKTLSQVDQLAHVFDVLRTDMKQGSARELFVYYQATPIIMTYFKPLNKALLGNAVDIFLQMCTESDTLQPFLASCSSEAWFKLCAIILRTPNVDTKVTEKMSIILQKLSRTRSNKRYFDIYSITSIIQELLVNSGNEGAFLTLNLKSILLNLNGKKASHFLGDT